VACFVYIVDVCTRGQKAPNFTGLAMKARHDQGLAHSSHDPDPHRNSGLSTRRLFTTRATAGSLASSSLQPLARLLDRRGLGQKIDAQNHSGWPGKQL
jgi:hypothetical protein